MSSLEISGLAEFERDLGKVVSEKYPTEARKFMEKQADDLKTQAMRETPDNLTKEHWQTATASAEGESGGYIEFTVTNNAPNVRLTEKGHKRANRHGKYRFYPGSYMLEKAVVKKEDQFGNELNTFIRRVLEELEL